MPIYEHFCNHCQQLWEDLFSIKDPVPTVCELCGQEGGVKRVLSVPAQGVVELSGAELKAHLKSEGAKFKREFQSGKDENFVANCIGENKYQAQATAVDKALK